VPVNFSFVIPGKLAGAGRFGSGQQLQEDLWILGKEGIGGVVCLTSQPPEERAMTQAGLACLHLPVHDFDAPSPDQIDAFVAFVDEQNAAGRGVVAYCGAGLGRTGTLLASYLVHLGEDPEEAIESIRRIRPGSVETLEQEACVAAYAGRLQAARGMRESQGEEG